MSVRKFGAPMAAVLMLSITGAGPGRAQAPEAPAVAPDAGVIAPDEAPAPRVRRRRKPEAVENPATGDLPGRYAVMRDKHDTGCMLTLDRARAKSGSRAQLAPGCRDQGIIVFDPASWQIVKGALVLTARAGHKARLQKEAEGIWAKDPKEGKPLGLKKL